jgi:hypothetical protein
MGAEGMTVLDEIIRIDFESITQWVLKGDKIGPISFKCQDHGGWLYAFAVEGEVKYIGLTNRVLRSRMSDYVHINNSQTDRPRRLIVNMLAAGQVVSCVRLETERPQSIDGRGSTIASGLSAPLESDMTTGEPFLATHPDHLALSLSDQNHRC